MKEIKIPITTETDFDKPSLERPHAIQLEGSGKGTQKFWRFKNGYGASVVRFRVMNLGGSYGAKGGLWELAVIDFKDNDFKLTYKTSITEDVIGYLTEEKVAALLKRIKRLRKK